MEYGPKRRACLRCRNNKTRCLLDETHPDICQRCMRLGHSCVFAPTTQREPRKATHTRVEELEKNINALHALLREKDRGTSSNAAEPSETLAERRESGHVDVDVADADESEEPATTANAGRSQRLLDNNNTSVWSQITNAFATQNQHRGDTAHRITTLQNRRDVIDEGLLSMETARQFLQQYRIGLYPHYPVVYIPSAYSADDLRKTKPMLFLAVLGAVAGKDNPDLAVKLDGRALEEYAIRCVIDSEKSLELVQSLLINAIWFQPPKRLNQLKFNDYIRMAATMSMDIGLSVSHSRRTPSTAPVEIHGQSAHPLGNQYLDPNISIHNLATDTAISSIESRRALLGVYISSANISITLRRPAIMIASSHIHECVEVLEQSPEALPSDKELAAWTRLLIISDDIGTSFSYNDLHSVASILDLKTQMMLTIFQEKLAKWRTRTYDSDLSGPLGMTYFAIRLYLLEIVLYLDFPPEDFRAPFQMSAPRKLHPQVVARLPIKPVAEAITQLLQSSHDLLDVFLHMNVESARCLPMFCYIRLSSAIFILAKLSRIRASKDSTLQSLCTPLDIKMESYLSSVLLRLREIVASNKCRVPAVFITLLTYVQKRSEAAKRAATQNNSRGLEPLLPERLADSRVIPVNNSNSEETTDQEGPPTAPVSDFGGSPWSQPMDDVNWQGNVLSFPGAGFPLGHNDQNTWMSCPTQ